MTRFELVETRAPLTPRTDREACGTSRSCDSRWHGLYHGTPMRRFLHMRIAALGVVLLAGCGGGGGDGPVDAGSASAPAAAAASVPVTGATSASASASAASSSQTGNPSSSSAGSSIGGNGNGDAPVSSASSGSSGSSTAVPASLADFAYYRLGSVAQAGVATIRAGSLNIDGRQSSSAMLTAGSCNGGAAFSQCASSAGANVFTLCSSDGGAGPGSDRIRSRYVLYDPAAERVTDATMLRNLSFSGFENCGQDNVGAQPKSGPSATLRFDNNGNLTLTRFDRDPARSSTLPAFLVDLNNDTVSGGQSARFNVYRSNGRYLIIATSLPTAGVNPGDPGTLVGFVQQ